MNINQHVLILTLLIAGLISVDAKILDMDNDQLDKSFKGYGSRQERIDYEDLADELNTPDGPALIRKFLSDERLKKPLYGQISHIKDEAVRNGLLVIYLRDHAIWATGYNGLRDLKMSWAAGVSECVFKHFPAMRKDRNQSDALTYVLLTPQGRNAVAAAYQKYLDAPLGKPGEGDAREAQLLDGINEAMVKYGTKEFVYPPEPGLPSSSNQPFPFKIESLEKDTEPGLEPPVMEEKSATISFSSIKPWLIWAAGVSAALVAANLIHRFRRRSQRG